MGDPHVVEYTTYEASVAEALDAVGAATLLRQQTAVMIKPNLINSSPPPITTPVACCRAIAEYVRAHSRATVVIAEGCGDAVLDTPAIFEAHGYARLADEFGLELVDLNAAPTTTLHDDSCTIFPEFHMPRIAMSHFIISVPVLKAHSLAEVSGSMKNMMGLAPPAHYQRGGHWKKSCFHERMHESIVELNRYRTPELTLMDATVGMAEYHLGGPECDPPVNKLVAGTNARDVDRIAAGLLGFDWTSIPHLA
jgi:uncharacterized protein (DUF362 family)